MSTSHAPSFISILDQAPGEVDRPKLLPPGTYHCTVGTPEPGKSSKKGTPFLKFPLAVQMALDDVDPEALEEAGGIDGRHLSTTFYITEDAVFMLDQFHQNCGLDLPALERKKVSRSSRNEMVINSEVLALLSHRPDDNDPTRVYAEVRRTAPVK